jgi:putative membrane protein
MHIKRTIAQILLFALGIYLVSFFMPGLYIENFVSALLFTLLATFLISLLWPLIVNRMERFLILTFGVGALVLVVFALWVGSLLIPGVAISGWGWITAPIAIAFVSAFVTVILNVDDDDVYARSVYAHLKRRREKAVVNGECSRTGFVFLEIDGLPEAVLRQAMEKGKMPFLADLVKNGGYRIKGWETDLSSQTGASQAGILHGYNRDIPAFRWVEKSENNRIVSSNGIGDAPMVQARISNGKGLLSVNGGAVSNLFTGDSKDNVLVYSVIKNIRQLYSESWTAFYARPFNFARVGVLAFGEIFLEIRSRYRQRVKNIQPRLENRGLMYYFARIGANVILREISTYIVIGDIIAGDKDVIYTTYLGYDEVAHHCGITDEESFNVLQKIDHRISRIFLARKYSNRPYQICILSDHGQTNGATFKQRYGFSLDALVKMLLPENENIYHELNSNQDHFNQMITVPREMLNRKLKLDKREKRKKDAGTIVLASGNLGLIYFTKFSQRLFLEEINSIYPNMIPGLISHQGIGFIMVQSKEHGAMVLGAKGKYYLEEERIEGENPLAKYSVNAAKHLRRTCTFKYLPDILVMSLYDESKDEVSAFEELVGSHGGLGGNQSKPFIACPKDWNLQEENIVGAEQLYHIFKRETENEVLKNNPKLDSVS